MLDAGRTRRRPHWPATPLVECPQILDGRSQAQVKALLGAADDDRGIDDWIYDLGTVDASLFGNFLSAMPTLVVRFDASNRVTGVTAVGID
ncbi:hypothetical protein [Solirubrobacter soli]|uniref:hypothetical protein n=1 Tax=Solirubrobacter soli TaxID=363832 RepID=UPI0004182078|nr:hypothetical protein [Solirubrobacter soli]